MRGRRASVLIGQAHDFVLGLMNESCPLGYELLPDGTQVFGRVPHVAPQAWLHEMYAPLTEQDIAMEEAAIRRQIPEPYRSWLLRANGLNAFSGGLVLYGRRSDYSRRASVIQPYDLDIPNVLERLPDAHVDAFFIGSVLGGENLLFLLPSSGQVYACDRRSARGLTSWPSVPQLIVSAVAALGTSFDGQGRAVRPLHLYDLSRNAAS